MKSLLKYVKKSFNAIKSLNNDISLLLDDTEELVRRCKKKAIKNNGKVHKNAFYFGYHNISVDRAKYRPYKKTIQEIPENESIDNWRLIKGTVQYIRPIKGVENIKADPQTNNSEKSNPAHALIICDSREEKKNEIAESLSEVFQKIPPEKYKL